MRDYPQPAVSSSHRCLAIVLSISLGFWPLSAQSQDDAHWGCTLLLCFANPAGPMAAPACVPPVRRLVTEMTKFWKRFRLPACMSAEAQGSRLEIRPLAYEACPPDMQALQAGAKVVIGTTEQARAWQNSDPHVWLGRLASEIPSEYGMQWRQPLENGIGEGEQELQEAHSQGRPARNKVCVGGALGTAHMPHSKQDERGQISSYIDDIQTVFLFEQLEVIAPPKGSMHYQVHVDFKPFSSGTL